MPDFVISVSMDATDVQKGKRVAVSAVDEIQQSAVKAFKMLDKYDNQLAKILKYDSELRRLNKILAQENVSKGIDETTKAVLRQKAALVDAAREAQRLEKEQNRAIQSIKKGFSEAGQVVNNFGQSLQNIGMGMTAVITAPLVLAGKSLLKLGTEYETNLNVLQTTSKATDAEMQKIAKTAMDLGADLTLPSTSAADAAKAMLELAKGGLTAQEAMEAAKGTLQLATAASIEGAEAAEIQANALNAFGLAATEATRIADLLAATANASSVEIKDIAFSFQQASASFASAKVPIEDVATAIGLLGNAGLKGADAGTSLKTFLSSLTSPRNADAVATLEKLGVSVFDLQGKFVGMPSVISQFEKGLTGLTDAQKQQYLYTIFGSDATRAANILFKTNSDVINAATKSWDEMSVAVQRSNAAADLAQARTKGLGGAWKALKSQLETFGLVIYEAIKTPLTNALASVAQFASYFINAFSSLSQGTQQVIVAIVAIAAALGPVLYIAGLIAPAFVTAISAISTFGGAILSVGGAISTFIGIAGAAGIGGALSAVGTTITTVVLPAIAPFLAGLAAIIAILATVAAATTTFYLLWQSNFGGIRDFALKVWADITNTVNTAITYLVSIWNSNGQSFIASIQAGFQKVLSFIEPIFAQIVAGWSELWAVIKEVAGPVFDQIVQLVQNKLQQLVIAIQIGLILIQQFWATHGEAIKQIVSGIWLIVKTIVVEGVRAIANVIRLVLALINGDWASAWDAFKNIIQTSGSATLAILRGLVNIIVGILKSIISSIIAAGSNILTAALQLGRNLIAGIVNGISERISTVRTKIGEVVEMVKNLPAVGWLIKSPSRLFYQYGAFLIEGLTLGIEATSPKLAATVKKSIVDRVKNLKKDLQDVLVGNTSLQQTDEAEFKTQFDLLNANEAKSKLEELIKLRVELGANFDKPVPSSFSAVVAEINQLTLQKEGLEETIKLLQEFDKVTSAKLPEDASNLEKVNALLADPARSAGIDATTKAMLQLSAVAADLADNSAQINKEFDSLSKQNVDKISDLKKQLRLFGVEDPTQKREIEYSFEDLSKFTPDQQQQILDQRGVELGQIRELDLMKKRADGVKNYEGALKNLNEVFREKFLSTFWLR